MFSYPLTVSIFSTGGADGSTGLTLGSSLRSLFGITPSYCPGGGAPWAMGGIPWTGGGAPWTGGGAPWTGGGAPCAMGGGAAEGTQCIWHFIMAVISGSTELISLTLIYLLLSRPPTPSGNTNPKPF